MRLGEFATTIGAVGPLNAEDRIVVQKPDGSTMTITGVEREVHEDADGSVTWWVKAEDD